MTVKNGDTLPEAQVYLMTDGGPQAVSTTELFAGKKTVLFALPGAYTPTCSAAHLPGFVVHNEAIKAKGVDQIVCLSVNDPFVMKAWGEANNVEDQILMAADGNGEFTEAVGLTMDGRAAGLGTRSQRYAMIIDDGKVSYLAVEKPKTFEVSSAEAVLNQL